MWATALRCGIPQEVIWELAVPEIEAVVAQKNEDERNAGLRAGLIAAAVYNVHRRKGARMLQAADFVAMPDDYLTPEAAASYMDAWAATQNSGIVAPTDAEIERYSGG